MEENFTISVFADNTPGVLQRITAMFTRRKINIDTLTVSETEREGISRFTIVARISNDNAFKLEKQIQRIVEVQDTFVARDEQLLFREVALIRVACVTPSAREQIEEVAKRFSATLALTSFESMVLEKTGSEEDIRCLLEVLKPFGLLEFIRSGRVAIEKLQGDMDVGIFAVKQSLQSVYQ